MVQLKPKPFFVKEVFNNLENLSETSPSFKAIPSNLFAQCWKKYFRKPITEFDKKFMINGIRATYDVPLFE